MDIDAKKTMLLTGSCLYDQMIELAPNDVVRRYLAFRIIVNAMSFEDVIQNRCHPRLRIIRNTLLVHKQEPEFFEGYRAVNEISNSSITRLLHYMETNTSNKEASLIPLEITDGNIQNRFKYIVSRVLKYYAEQFLDGFRMTNNFLCYTGKSIHEISANGISGVFFRYNSSMSLYKLFQSIYNNTYCDCDLRWISRHAKLDMILHAQNLVDCVIRDTTNPYSIDGLLEVINEEGIGDAVALEELSQDSDFLTNYQKVRSVRNKLIGHMDRTASVTALLCNLDNLPITVIHDLVNSVDKSVYDTSHTHIVIGTRYFTSNVKLNEESILDIESLKVGSYY